MPKEYARRKLSKIRHPPVRIGKGLVGGRILGRVGKQTTIKKFLRDFSGFASSEDLKTKAKRALKAVIQKCVHLPALEPLLHDAPENILKYVVNQFAKVLPHDVAARRSTLLAERVDSNTFAPAVTRHMSDDSL